MSVHEKELSALWLTGGELAALTRSFDWSRTTVGPIDQWPVTLRTTVATLLACRQPMFLWWGDDLVQFYNDAYRPSLGRDRHPDALGARGREFWADIWEVIGPLIERVRAGGEPVWSEDQRIPILRDGGFQEVFWTFSYSPVHEGARVGGVLVVCNESTQKVLGERRLRTFKDLAVEGLSAGDEAEAARAAVRVLAQNPDDVPFAAIYLGGPSAPALTRIDHFGLPESSIPETIPAPGGSTPWSIFQAVREARSLWLDDAQRRSPGLAAAPWPEEIKSACVLPLRAPGTDEVRGAILLGFSPRIPVSETYRDFFSLVASQVGGMLARSHAGAETRRALEREHAAREDAERARLEVESERLRLKNLVHDAPAIFCTLRGPDHVFELVNPLYQRLVGGDRHLLGLPVARALPEVVAQGFIALLDRVYTTGEPVFGNEVKLILDKRGDGKLEEVYYSFVYQARRGSAGQTDGIDVFGFEVTSQVVSRRELEERAGFEQQLIGIVSHDLRSPLTGILLASKALLRRTEELDGRTTTTVARIQSSAERAVRLVRDLLDFTQARLGAGIPVLPKPTDLHELAQAALEELRATFADRELRLEQSGVARGTWDPDRLLQVITNLVTNAVKYGRLDSPVTVRTRGTPDGVLLEVHNLGNPIPPDRLGALFRPLQRDPLGPPRDLERSVGLGLYIVHQVVRGHGGRVEVSSNAAAGTTFSVRLPLSPPAS